MAEQTRRYGLRVAALLAGSTIFAMILAGPAGSETPGRTMSITTEHVAGIGTVLATSSGRTLYHFTSDPKGRATCTGGCAKVWPPLLLPKGGRIRGEHGLKGFALIHLGHGHSQVSFHGDALYRFSGDTRKGQANGQGQEGVWFAALKSGMTPAASPNAAVPATTPATTTPTTRPPTPATTTPKTTPTSTPATTPPTTTPPPTPPTTTRPPPGGYGY